MSEERLYGRATSDADREEKLRENARLSARVHADYARMTPTPPEAIEAALALVETMAKWLPTQIQMAVSTPHQDVYAEARRIAALLPKPVDKDAPQALELRPNASGKFDEIVARKPDMVHVETMSSKGVYIGFYWNDGSGYQLWISSESKLRYNHAPLRAGAASTKGRG